MTQASEGRRRRQAKGLLDGSSKAVVIIQLKDGSIRPIRTRLVDNAASESGLACQIYDEDMAGADKGDVQRIVGNYFDYPDWVKLTDEQIAFCEAWIHGAN